MIFPQIDSICAAAGAGDEITPQAFADETDVLLKMINAEKTESAIPFARGIKSRTRPLPKRPADASQRL